MYNNQNSIHGVADVFGACEGPEIHSEHLSLITAGDHLQLKSNLALRNQPRTNHPSRRARASWCTTSNIDCCCMRKAFAASRGLLVPRWSLPNSLVSFTYLTSVLDGHLYLLVYCSSSRLLCTMQLENILAYLSMAFINSFILKQVPSFTED